MRLQPFLTEGKDVINQCMGQLASELLAQQLAFDGPTSGTGELRWTSRNLGVPSVDLEDKETLHALLDHGA